MMFYVLTLETIKTKSRYKTRKTQKVKKCDFFHFLLCTWGKCVVYYYCNILSDRVLQQTKESQKAKETTQKEKEK